MSHQNKLYFRKARRTGNRCIVLFACVYICRFDQKKRNKTKAVTEASFCITTFAIAPVHNQCFLKKGAYLCVLRDVWPRVLCIERDECFRLQEEAPPYSPTYNMYSYIQIPQKVKTRNLWACLNAYILHNNNIYTIIYKRGGKKRRIFFVSLAPKEAWDFSNLISISIPKSYSRLFFLLFTC